jgi:hypothetical protein
VKQTLPPGSWLAAFISLLCLYLPVGWITFSSRVPFWLSYSERLVFLFTSPGEWIAQRCGARMYDYYFFAGIATIVLLALGISIGRRGWLGIVFVNLALCGWSAITAQWLWNELGR